MKKKIISFLLCGTMVLSMFSSIDILAEGINEKKAELELIKENNITEMVTEKKSNTEIRTEIMGKAEILPETETNREVENHKNESIEVKVGDTFKTYFGEFQILTVGENPTVSVIGGMRTDYDDNFIYGDPTKPWVAKYLDVEYAVTRISAHMPGLYINIPEGIEYIDNQVFKFDSTKELVLPSTLMHFDEEHALPFLESITVAEGNQYYKSIDNVLFTADGEQLLLFPAKDLRKSYTTPEGTDEIAYGAFGDNFNLLALNLDFVKIVDRYAFYGMQNIESINFSKELISFDLDYTFYKCNKLQNVYVDESNPYYYDDNGIFYFKNGGNFGLICYPASHNLASYKIPYGVNEIYQFAFAQTSVTAEITVPATMRYIFTGAFRETKTAMDIVIQSSRTKNISQGAFEELCDGSKVIVPTEEIKNGIRKDAFLINYVIDDRIPIHVDYERAVSRRNNWYVKDGKKYYYDDNGEFLRGFCSIGDFNKYYFDPEGAQQIGFINHEGKRYYFNPASDGMLFTSTGFQTIHDRTYYFNEDNSIYLRRERKEYGITYYFNTDTGEVICDSNSHVFGDWKVMKPATCTQLGITEHSCSKCETRETKNIPKSAHSYNAWNIIDKASCTIEGRRERVCTVIGCGSMETEVIPKTAHVDGACTVLIQPTCTISGSKALKCSVCNTILKRGTIAATGHKYGEWKITALAKVEKDGRRERVCRAGDSIIRQRIEAIKPTSISKASVGTIKNVTYSGKYLSVSPTVKIGNKKLVKSKDYTLSYKNNKYPGKATVKITGKGNYSGYKNVSFHIVPKAPSSVNVKSPKKGNIVVKYERATGATGYSISYSTSSKFKRVKTTTTSASSKTVNKLSSKQIYYVKTRSYVSISGKKFYSLYSPVRRIKIK